MKFTPTATREPLSDAEQARQGQAVRIAQAAFGDNDLVIAFLNSRHSTLCRRPLELAIESDAGLAAVKDAILAARPWPI